MHELTMCGRCHKAVPCFCITFSELPDDQKCRCASPVYPDPPIVTLFRWLFGARS